MRDRRWHGHGSRLRSPFLLVTCALLGLALTHCAKSGDQPAAAGPGAVDAMRERILAQVAPKPGMTVAEIGVGPGWFVVRIAEAAGPDGVVYGTDIDPEAITSLQRRLPDLRPPAARVELRLCRDERDTALDDLPDNHLDIVNMIDSLCFGEEARERNVAYLRRLLRILRPGGRFVHHMDCRCDVLPDAVVALFTEAGFSPQVESVDVSPDPALVDPSWPCRTEAERRRHAWLAVFRKPGTTPNRGAVTGTRGP